MGLSRQQFTLLGIFALFMGPVILVILMRSSWWQYQPAGLKNRGHLVQPPVHLDLDETRKLDGKWLILYVPDDPCSQPCIEHATALRQIHRASGRDQDHLAIVLLDNSRTDSGRISRLESIYPEFILLADPADRASQTLAVINSRLQTDGTASDPMHTYILDPMLNVILAYGVNSNPGDIHKDLKRLLKWSKQENGR